MEQTIGKRIAANRKHLGLTQEALADKLGITAQAVSKWENDLSCPDITMLPKLAEIFGITTDQLLGIENPQVHTAEVVQDETKDGVHVQKGSWEFHWDGGRKDSLATALCVLCVGVLTLISRSLEWDVSFWSILWPNVLLFYGLRNLFPRFGLFPLCVTLFGGYALLANLHFLPWDIASQLVFPICILIFGVSLLMDALRRPKKPHVHIRRKGGNNDKTKYDCQTNGGEFVCDLAFGQNTYCVDATTLTGGVADVSFGELTIDLSGCETVAEACHITGDCSFGSLVFLVPCRFRVEHDADSTFASIRISGQPDATPSGTIHMDADVSFGEICIRYI